MGPERIELSAKERDRLKVLHEVGQPQATCSAPTMPGSLLARTRRDRRPLPAYDLQELPIQKPNTTTQSKTKYIPPAVGRG